MARRALLALTVISGLLAGNAARAAGQVTAEADTELGFAEFRAATGLTGQGVTVAIFGYTFWGYEAALAQQELPVITFKYRTNDHVLDVGTRLAEIVHDIAPGATLQGYTLLNPVSELPWDLNDDYWDGTADIALIADDSYSWPTFASSHQSIAAIEKRIEEGVLFVTNAGDDRLTHYRGTFTDAGNGFHDFGGGVTAMPVQFPGDCYTVGGTLSWGDPYGTYPYSEYYLYLYDGGMNVLEIDGGASTPWTSVGEDLQPPGTYYLGVWKDPAAPVRDIDLYIYPCEIIGGFEPKYPVMGLPNVPEHSVSGVAAVAGALAVAALDRGSPEPRTEERALFGPRGYSGEGPARLLTEQLVERVTPHLAATDCQSTFTAPGYQCGSSAAAAVVAGAAALLQEHYRLDRPAELAGILMYSARDIASTGSGWDGRTGYGQVDIWAAYQGQSAVPAADRRWLAVLLVMVGLASWLPGSPSWPRAGTSCRRSRPDRHRSM
ncbi:MAG: S8 family serine peptidase [Candidatus Schekmanbacteria bacterium]|nr:S8 family serine peptidase [Candidatus Schekmanbacteria bacterium]